MQAIVVFLAIHVIMVLSSINNTAVAVAFPDITATHKTFLVLAGVLLASRGRVPSQTVGA